jgi:hypothetical protein
MNWLKLLWDLFKAGLYQTFAGLFGASLKKQYDPEGDDRMIERIVLQVQNVSYKYTASY